MTLPTQSVACDSEEKPTWAEIGALNEKVSCGGINCGKCNDCLAVNLHFALMAVASQTSQKLALEGVVEKMREAGTELVAYIAKCEGWETNPLHYGVFKHHLAAFRVALAATAETTK